MARDYVEPKSYFNADMKKAIAAYDRAQAAKKTTKPIQPAKKGK